MAKKTVYRSEDEAQRAKDKAVRFVEDVIGDPDRSSEIEDEDLDTWLEETGRKIQNPKKSKRRNQTMPRKSQADRIADLEAENEELRQKVEDYEAERLDALEALGVEIIDEDENDEGEDSEIEEGEERS